MAPPIAIFAASGPLDGAAGLHEIYASEHFGANEGNTDGCAPLPHCQNEQSTKTVERPIITVAIEGAIGCERMPR